MGLLDWGDRIDDRVLGRFGRPPDTLESGDPEVESWWAALSLKERRNVLVDANRGELPTGNMVDQRRRNAIELLQLRQTRRFAGAWLLSLALLAGIAAIALLLQR